mmetsp:Transcript_19384/g.23080  ORF Transcript_19384/g.23080 Transcript_19384/m.23080 type:complete len:242 (+) Transcript_19384:1095-1820(+)
MLSTFTSTLASRSAPELLNDSTGFQAASTGTSSMPAGSWGGGAHSPRIPLSATTQVKSCSLLDMPKMTEPVSVSITIWKPAFRATQAGAWKERREATGEGAPAAPRPNNRLPQRRLGLSPAVRTARCSRKAHVISSKTSKVSATAALVSRSARSITSSVLGAGGASFSMASNTAVIHSSISSWLSHAMTTSAALSFRVMMIWNRWSSAADLSSTLRADVKSDRNMRPSGVELMAPPGVGFE